GDGVTVGGAAPAGAIAAQPPSAATTAAASLRSKILRKNRFIWHLPAPLLLANVRAAAATPFARNRCLFKAAAPRRIGSGSGRPGSFERVDIPGRVANPGLPRHAGDDGVEFVRLDRL